MVESIRYEERFAELATEWRGLSVATAIPAEDRFRAMSSEARAIRAAGGWVTGPADLLTILGRHRDELFHSRLLAWLLRPSGRHGLGHGLLRALLDTVWPGERLADEATPVVVELERTRSGTSEATEDALEARADIVVYLDDLVVVIENKLDAGEQPGQCERLYWAWANEATEVRWLFLTPTGRAPATATSTEAMAAWRTASYPQVREALGAAIAGTSERPSDGGRASALQYLATLSSWR